MRINRYLCVCTAVFLFEGRRHMNVATVHSMVFQASPLLSMMAVQAITFNDAYSNKPIECNTRVPGCV